MSNQQPEKAFGRLIAKRIEKELGESDGLSENQYGFRRGRSTVDAVNRVKGLASYINSGAYQRRKVCILTLL